MDYWHLTRCTGVILMILPHIPWTHTSDYPTPVTGEYCVRETFQPECGEDEVIMLQYAKYGRMQLGKCIKSDFGLTEYMGCYSDVLRLVDSMCSGRRRCEIALPDARFEATNPCDNQELINYLEVSHICLPVMTFNQATCSSERGIRITSPSSGYLASQITEESGCGGTDHPWIITASSGQTVSLTLIDFDHNEGVLAQTGTCAIYAVIKEPSAQTTKTVCGGQDKERVVFQSMGDTIEIQVRASSEKHFLFHYQFIGCADPGPVEGRGFVRNGNVGTWTCEDYDVSWTLRCDGVTWMGEARECSPTPPIVTAFPIVTTESISAGPTSTITSFSWKMVLILVAIVTVGMVACVLIIAIVCLKRSRARGVQHPVTQYPLYEVYDMPVPRRVSERDAPQAYYQSLPKDYHSKKTYSDNTVPRDGRYDKPVWERPLPRPPGRGEFDA